LLGVTTVGAGSLSAGATGQPTTQTRNGTGKHDPPLTVASDSNEQTEVTIENDTDSVEQAITTADSGVSIAWRDPLSTVSISSGGPGTDTFAVTPNLVIGNSLIISPNKTTTFRFINETEGLSVEATLNPDKEYEFTDRLQVTLVDTDGSITANPDIRFVRENGGAVRIPCTISGVTNTFSANPVASYTAELIEDGTVQATASPDRLFIGYTPSPEIEIDGTQFEAYFEPDGLPPRTDITLQLYDAQATDNSDGEPNLALSSSYKEAEDRFEFEKNS
jgi:hypothetical protein